MNARLPIEHLTATALTGTVSDVDMLAQAWLPHIYRWCHRLGGPHVDAEDAAHEVVITMCRKIGSVKHPDAFPSWLYQLTRRTMANHRRKAWWKRWVPGAKTTEGIDLKTPHRSAESRQIGKRVWEALDKLSEEQRDVIVLCMLEEHSATEASVLLGIPTGTVKSRLRLARKNLKQQFEAAGMNPQVSARTNV